MSLVKTKAIQMGFDATPTNNFLIYQPLTPDGTFRIANGNQGATTDIMTVTSGGSVTFAGTTNFSSLNFGAGSESAPSLFPTGDSNTGIWFPAADTFAVSTGGTERLRVASDGKIGIGISPVVQLHLGGIQYPVQRMETNNSTTGDCHFELIGGRNSDGNIGYISFTNKVSGSNDTVSRIVAKRDGANDAASLSFLTKNTGGSLTERARISSAGDLGVGVVGPTVRIEAHAVNPTNGILSMIRNDASTGFTGAQMQFSQNTIGDWVIGQPAATNAFAIWRDRNTASTGTELFKIDSVGRILTGGVSADSYINLGSIVLKNGSQLASGGFAKIWIPGQQIGSTSYSGLYGFANTYLAYYNSGWKSTGGGHASAITIDEGNYSFCNSNSVAAPDSALTWTTRLTINTNGNSTFNTSSGTGITLNQLVSGNGADLKFTHSENAYIAQISFRQAADGNDLVFALGDGGATERLRLTTAGHLIPGANASYDLGSTSKAWRNVYTNDLHLSNEGHEEGNSVDGTKGNWTVQEGEDNLYIINNKTGKKYKFALEEIQ